ncbi:hypothetical protein [Streptomyces sp. NPDC058653]|uniref:hypothetical protein n=1 Tax=Streptomyces sp. NPDC058653 TaxID=3346576 RepID=UPI003664DA20
MQHLAAAEGASSFGNTVILPVGAALTMAMTVLAVREWRRGDVALALLMGAGLLSCFGESAARMLSGLDLWPHEEQPVLYEAFGVATPVWAFAAASVFVGSLLHVLGDGLTVARKLLLLPVLISGYGFSFLLAWPTVSAPHSSMSSGGVTVVATANIIAVGMSLHVLHLASAPAPPADPAALGEGMPRPVGTEEPRS